MTQMRKAAANQRASRKIRVLLVEDHQVLREGLIALMEGNEDVTVCDTASTAEEGLEKVHKDLDLVILDLSLPGRDGIWLSCRIKEELPSLPILVLTMHDQSEFVLKALEAGVDGYITKCAGQQEILKAIHSVVRTGSYLQARIAPYVINALRSRTARAHALKESMFSEREHEIARCLVKGFSNSEIARKIRLSVSTVKADLRSLYTKLEVSTRTEAAAVVIQRGLVCAE